jgi:N-acyl-D-amino-acid deacylase
LREIDASGLVVAPGFIDIHTHTDEIYRMLGRVPLPGSMHANLNYVTQGVTTIVTGNCGSGFAVPEEITSWLDRIDALPFGTNVIHLIPHGGLRLQVMGGVQADRPDPRPTPQELGRMRELVDRGMRAGAWGLSTGLAFDPVKIRDVATFEESGRESEGIEYLFVNGVPTIESGEFTGRRAGRALRWIAPGGSASPGP